MEPNFFQLLINHSNQDNNPCHEQDQVSTKFCGSLDKNFFLCLA